MEHLSGKGMFIWQIAHCEGGDVDAIVGRAKQAGLTHVLIKIADGRAAYNGDPADLVLALLDAGIKPWAWQYTYGSHPADEAVFGARRFSELPFAGFVIDAEFEYKGHPQQALAYMDALRTRLPDATVALSSYYLPDLHPTFPWREFLTQCDINMPQVYWYDRGPQRALQQSLEQNQRFGKPVFPTGAAYPEAATADQITLFLSAVNETGLAGANFWSWQHATDAMWKAVAEFSWRTPRVVVAVQNGEDFVYRDIASRFHGDQFLVRPADLAALVGLVSPDAAWLPLREAARDLNLNTEYRTDHLADPDDPRLYVFIYEPLPEALPGPRLVITAPSNASAVSGVVPVSGRVGNLDQMPDSAAVTISVHTNDQWTSKGRASWAQSGAQDWILSPGWDTTGTPPGLNAIEAVLTTGDDGHTVDSARIDVTVQKPGLTLAEVADGAERKRFISQSYSWKSGTGRRYLDRVSGLCRAYAAECLAEFYLGTKEPNKRHTQQVFTYSNVAVVGDDAGEWAAALRRGIDSHLGTWVDGNDVYPGALQAGDMVFWMDGVNGYRGKHGHVAIVVRTDGDTIVSENSSSRRIGTHSISARALATMAGVMRWHR